jgi:hypothetical protein
MPVVDKIASACKLRRGFHVNLVIIDPLISERSAPFYSGSLSKTAQARKSGQVG